jgi:nucleoside-diphosphate-sugar epimerase
VRYILAVDVLLTGATGFLGKHVSARLISAGFTVIAPMRLSSSTSCVGFENLPGLINWQIPEEGTKSLWKEFPGIKGIVHTATNYGRRGSGLSQVKHGFLNQSTDAGRVRSLNCRMSC